MLKGSLATLDLLIFKVMVSVQSSFYSLNSHFLKQTHNPILCIEVLFKMCFIGSYNCMFFSQFRLTHDAG